MADQRPETVTEPAPAKINLALHVTGQRADGYHLMQSLVTFTQCGDRLTMSAAETDRISLSGRFAHLLGPADRQDGNLVVRARDAFRAAVRAAGAVAPPVHIHLEKNLPIASGIGGGSADAAAVLRGLSRLWDKTLTAERLALLAVGLGADVPMCLASRPLIARGIGDEIEPLPHLPALPMVLANPLTGVSTPQVFRLLAAKNNPPLSTETTAAPHAEWIARLGLCRNDLEPPARRLLGDIAVMSHMLQGQGAGLVRMSGSGATCFGIFDDHAAAQTAALALHRQRPDWYFQATETIAWGTP